MRVLLPKRGSLNCGRNCRSSTLFQFGDASVSTAASLTWPSARARADVGVVADQEHDRAVRAAANRVRAVIAHARRRVAVDPLDPIHHVVAVGVLELVEAGHAARRGLILSTAPPPPWLRRRAGCAGCARRRGSAATLLSASELRLGGQRRIAGHFAAAIARRASSGSRRTGHDTCSASRRRSSRPRRCRPCSRRAARAASCRRRSCSARRPGAPAGRR